MANKAIIFSEDVITYALYKNYLSNEKIIAYELKGMRRGRKRETLPEDRPPEFPAFYDGIGQALAYLNLPYVSDLRAPKESREHFDKFSGGAFDFVYLVYPRDKIENFPEYEKRIINLIPIGMIFVTLDGKFGVVKEAPQNPLQSKEAKRHLLENLSTLEKFSVNSKIFRKIREKGEQYFSKL